MTSERELVIRENTPELSVALIKAVNPEAVPFHFRFGFTALSSFNDIPMRGHHGEIERYLAQCVNSKIVPYSNLKFDYDYHSKRWLQDVDHSIPNYSLNGISDAAYDIAQEMIVKGGKHHLITYEVGHSLEGVEALAAFKDGVLSNLVPNYFPSRGQVSLKMEYSKHGCYDDGGYESVVSVSYRNPGEITLKTDSRAEEEDIAKYQNWFEEFAKANNKKISRTTLVA